MLRRRGLDPEGTTRIVDGSGLSTQNRTTAATLARLLHAFDRDLLRGPILYTSLARPGEEGTLKRRLPVARPRPSASTPRPARSGTAACTPWPATSTAGTASPATRSRSWSTASASGRGLIDDLVVEMARR